ncbi:MAG: hypothetical protein ETSY2_14145 [Candidatus Entotheonella gemina]|uniref:Uncharacterized protein n=1 Tax=Candidatus Entotheonella gemina TaxID=1429439 RepID=W4M9Q3_9BACT|nr:MAG: hypothetical protein ETSY2_14145 [Candidatus Entotheonella gemina]
MSLYPNTRFLMIAGMIQGVNQMGQIGLGFSATLDTAMGGLLLVGDVD